MTFARSILRPLKHSAILAFIALSVHAAALDPATGTSAEFFGLDKVYTFHLTLNAAEYKKMEPPGGGGMARPGISGDDRYPTASASLEFEGKKWGTLNLRYKGNSSYRSAGALKRPIKLEFEADGESKDKARTFFGMGKLNLNNNAMDASQIREALGYDIFRREGVPAARTAFARLYITVPGTYDNQYAGLYTVVEQIDQTFFKDRFGKKTGPVVKPEGLFGMPYLGDDWNSYLIRYGAKSADKIDPEDAKRFIAFVRFVNQASDDDFAAHIGDFVDVDEFLHFLAVEVMTVNLDSPLGMNHNYYVTLNPKTKKVTWVPWDLNLAFGGFGGGRGGGANSAQDLSVNKPSSKGQFPLADRILATTLYLKQYDAIVRALATQNFTVQRLSDEMNLMASAIRTSVKEDTAVAFTQFERNMSADPSAVAANEYPADSGFGGGFGFGRGGFGGRGMGGPPLRQFVALRVESVLEQLDGKREGFTSTGRGGRGGGRGFGGPPPDFPN
jgi:spore coat protein H